MVLSDGGVVVAAAGIRRPRVVISAGALVSFDEQELDASLDHEQGHIDHHHRFILLAAAVCSTVGRALPGTRAATAELADHLERDADAFALRREAAPAALASAICKASTAQLAGFPVTAMNGGSATRRVTHVLEAAEPLSRFWLNATRALAGTLACLTMGALAILPAGEREHPGRRCGLARSRLRALNTPFSPRLCPRPWSYPARRRTPSAVRVRLRFPAPPLGPLVDGAARWSCPSAAWWGSLQDLVTVDVR